MTLKINALPRGAGKTSLIKALHYLKADKDFIVLVENRASVSHVYKDVNFQDRIFTIQEFMEENQNLKGIKYNVIYIDEGLRKSSVDIAYMFWNLARMVNPLIDVIVLATPKDEEPYANIGDIEEFNFKSKIFKQSPKWFRDKLEKLDSTVFGGDERW